MTEQHNILIVDDDTGLRLSLFEVLKKERYRVETASNAEEALDCLRLHAYDLMFLDLNLPGRGGIELLAEVHRDYPDMSVLILTGNAELESAIQAVQLGARDYMRKPIEPVLIVTRVREILSERDQPARKREIVGQIQNLLAQLQEMDGGYATPTSELAAVPPSDPARFLRKGFFDLDLHARHATLKGRYLPVTGLYFDYLSTLVRHAPKAVAYKTLVKESQGFEVDMAEAQGLARWRIHELRRMIEVDPQQPQHILTVRGLGYRLAI